MWPVQTLMRLNRALLVLEAHADQARMALACPYGSSAEYDAALIRAGRQAGRYGPRRTCRRLAPALLVLALLGLALAL